MCGNVGGMVPTGFFEALYRRGSFLTSLPPKRCISDYTHCACRVTNAIVTRVGWMVEEWVAAARNKREAKKELQPL